MDEMRKYLPEEQLESMENKLYRAQKFREYLQSLRSLVDGNKKKILIVSHNVFGRLLTCMPEHRNPDDAFDEGIFLNNVECIGIDIFHLE